MAVSKRTYASACVLLKLMEQTWLLTSRACSTLATLLRSRRAMWERGLLQMTRMIILKPEDCWNMSWPRKRTKMERLCFEHCHLARSCAIYVSENGGWWRKELQLEFMNSWNTGTSSNQKNSVYVGGLHQRSSNFKSVGHWNWKFKATGRTGGSRHTRPLCWQEGRGV